jgi:glycosyltransferase involved in cell wall biosynthesis
MTAHPEHRESVRLLMIGSGGEVEEAKRVIAAAGLDRLVRDGELRHALGAAARLDVLAHHTWRAHVRRTVEALDARRHPSAA